MPAEFEPLEATLSRLRRERDEADRQYNDALTALDRALMRAPEFPHPPPAYDEHQITPLNGAWDIGAAPPSGGGLKGRLAAFVWRIAGPPLQKQAAFNSLLVDHLNRNVAAHREAHKAIASIVALLRAQVADLIAFHSRLLIFLQQITLYVDTTGRRSEGQALVVNAAVNALAEDLARRWESMIAREQRYEARVAGISAAHDELRALSAISQQAAMTAKRELERFIASGPTAGAGSEAPDLKVGLTGTLDSYKYVEFENQFRGSQDTIRARLESYLPYFASASDVLDVGCGRGEFLDLLHARGITARGLDLNHEMVEVCRARGLAVDESDAVSYLERVPDHSLGGLFAAQVVEHLQPAYLLRFLELAFHKLRPGAPIVLETLNPACWTAFFDSFIRDITHVWPLHPETLRYLVLASGFSSARIEYRSSVPPQDRLQTVAAPAGRSDEEYAETFNANVEKLNARLFSFLDYAIVGGR
jgi:2-polyprenyl-3-methyl-5-hydroxy-6-metoxy-1,4-benzoquinol methylase